MKMKLDAKAIITFQLTTLLSVLLLLTLGFGIINPAPGADQHVFSRLTYNLPEYSTSSRWIREDRPDLHWEEEWMPDRVFEDAYEKPIWVHPPLANVMAWPIVKLLWDQDGGNRELKILPVLTFLFSLYLVYLILKPEMESWKILLCFSPIPLMTTALYGVPHFYHDAFMIPALALTMYLVGRGSRWRYLAAACLVLTKLPAFAFLVPLSIWSKRVHSPEAFSMPKAYLYDLLKPGTWLCWKMLLPGLALVPYLLAVWHVTGDPIYLLRHWHTMSYYVDLHYENFLLLNIPEAILYSGYYIYIPILLISVWKFRSKPYAPVFGLIGLVLSSWAIIPYQMSQMLLFIPIMLSTILSKHPTRECQRSLKYETNASSG